MEISIYKFYYTKILIYAKSFVVKLVNISWCVSITFRVQIPLPIETIELSKS